METIATERTVAFCVNCEFGPPGCYYVVDGPRWPLGIPVTEDKKVCKNPDTKG